MSHLFRFAKEYSASPGRGYGSGVIQVLKKLSSPQLSDVYQPARDQFNGRGSFGNGGAMRAAPFALAFPDLADVRRVSSGYPLGKTHTCGIMHVEAMCILWIAMSKMSVML